MKKTLTIAKISFYRNNTNEAQERQDENNKKIDKTRPQGGISGLRR